MVHTSTVKRHRPVVVVLKNTAIREMDGYGPQEHSDHISEKEVPKDRGRGQEPRFMQVHQYRKNDAAVAKASP
eukprot:4226576-Pyramimonas_sp.AAC.1